MAIECKLLAAKIRSGPRLLKVAYGKFRSGPRLRCNKCSTKFTNNVAQNHFIFDFEIIDWSCLFLLGSSFSRWVSADYRVASLDSRWFSVDYRCFSLDSRWFSLGSRWFSLVFMVFSLVLLGFLLVLVGFSLDSLDSRSVLAGYSFFHCPVPDPDYSYNVLPPNRPRPPVVSERASERVSE